jgi:hypothetical protein
MARTYNILAPPLHATADATAAWFENKWGLKSNAIEVEGSIDPDINLRPTFNAKTADYHRLCIEVSDSLYPNYIDAFVLSCRDRGLPIKLFIAVRKGDQEQEYAQKLKAAKRAGVGILEVNNQSGEVIQNALSLSLTGVRAIDVQLFPKKFRQSLLQAEQTFRDGNPPKACAMVYDEIENYFRKLAQKAQTKGWWKNNPGFKLVKYPWANIITDLDKSLDRKACGCSDLTPAFMARILGVTPFRNDAGHKPNSAKALIKRDKESRTRFESAVDLFADLITATRTLHL